MYFYCILLFYIKISLCVLAVVYFELCRPGCHCGHHAAVEAIHMVRSRMASVCSTPDPNKVETILITAPPTTIKKLQMKSHGKGVNLLEKPHIVKLNQPLRELLAKNSITTCRCSQRKHSTATNPDSTTCPTLVRPQCGDQCIYCRHFCLRS